MKFYIHPNIYNMVNLLMASKWLQEFEHKYQLLL